MFNKIALTIVTLIILCTLIGCTMITPSASNPDRNAESTGTEAYTSGNQQMLALVTSKKVKLSLDANADGTTQQLAVKDILAITIESNPSTGYGWFAKSSNPEVIDILGESMFNEATSNATQPVLGAAGTETLYFEAASAGNATITLEYKRGWETDVAPEKVITINVEVK